MADRTYNLYDSRDGFTLDFKMVGGVDELVEEDIPEGTELPAIVLRISEKKPFLEHHEFDYLEKIQFDVTPIGEIDIHELKLSLKFPPLSPEEEESVEDNCNEEDGDFLVYEFRLHSSVKDSVLKNFVRWLDQHRLEEKGKLKKYFVLLVVAPRYEARALVNLKTSTIKARVLNHREHVLQ